jgi:RNA polymerase sigma-70 factor (ECF subfamily)
MSAHENMLRGLIRATTARFEVDWDAVYRQELPRIYNYFRYRLGDDTIAEDLTGTTFEKAWRARERYRRDLAGFSTWLLTIARNVATDHYRSISLRSRYPDVSLDAAHEYPAPDPPEVIYARSAELTQLGGLLAQLSNRDRELVALKYGADLNNRQIAQYVGMSESNVGTTLHRIVSKLRQQWTMDNEQ